MTETRILEITVEPDVWDCLWALATEQNVDESRKEVELVFNPATLVDTMQGELVCRHRRELLAYAKTAIKGGFTRLVLKFSTYGG